MFIFFLRCYGQLKWWVFLLNWVTILWNQEVSKVLLLLFCMFVVMHVFLVIFLLIFQLCFLFLFIFPSFSFFLLHFCGLSLPSSLPVYAFVFCWVSQFMFESKFYFCCCASFYVYLVIHSSLFRVSGFLLIFPLCFWFLFYLPAYQAIDEEASCRQAFFLFAIVHVCCYACFLTNFFTDFPTVFGSFLFSPAIDEEASSRQVFSPFAVMHVCFVDICFYLRRLTFFVLCSLFLLFSNFIPVMK